jgi:hypothetical protein
MKRRLPVPLAALVLLAAGSAASTARAQTFYGGNITPPVSPYVNLTRGGAPFGVNYYNIVQPQLQFQSEISQLQQQSRQFQSVVGGTGPLTTGHPAMFGDRLHYFPARTTGGLISPTTNITGLGGQQGLTQLQNVTTQNSPGQNLGRPPTGLPGPGGGGAR